MKYIGGNVFLGGEVNEIVKGRLKAEQNKHSQFRIVCRARGINHANEIVSELLGQKVFQREYSAETGNAEEIACFDDPNVKFIIYWLTAKKAMTNIEIEQVLEEKQKAKAEAAREIFEKIEKLLAMYSHLHKYAEEAREITEEYADGTPCEMTSVWEVISLHKNGWDDYETMNKLQDNIGNIEKSRLLKELEDDIAEIKKEYTEAKKK